MRPQWKAKRELLAAAAVSVRLNDCQMTELRKYWDKKAKLVVQQAMEVVERGEDWPVEVGGEESSDSEGSEVSDDVDTDETTLLD